MIVIGLTGRYCAGKNLVATLFEERGYSVIDVDTLGHQVLQSCVENLTERFGSDIRKQDGQVDRKVLGALVFADSGSLRDLEGIVHPQMVKQCITTIEDLEKQGKQVVVLNAALLHRMKLDVLCDGICFVNAPRVLRLVRAMRRDKATLKSFCRIERAQRDIRVGVLEGAKSVHVLENWGAMPFIHRQVQEFCATMGL